jgi:anti-sigma-K factor RskA
MTEHDHDIEQAQEDVFRALEESLPRVAPPPDLLDRVLADVGPEATVVPLRPSRRIRSWWAGGAAVAAAAAILVTAGIALRDSGPESPAARATLEARTEAGVTGEAALYAPDSGSGRLELSLRSVPASPAGHHYEVWVLPAGSDEMISVGTFHAETAQDVELEFDLPGAGTFAAVDVSVEEDDGPEEHSEISLSTGFFG